MWENRGKGHCEKGSFSPVFAIGLRELSYSFLT